MYPGAAGKTSTGHLSALLRGRFTGGHRRRTRLFRGDGEIAAVPRARQAARDARPRRPIRQSQNESRKFMKPCSSNRKLIAWLAVDTLVDRQTRSLRAHLETCEGSRRYLAEISNVAQKLSAAATPPANQAAESFHQRVLGALTPEETAAPRETLVPRLLPRSMRPIDNGASMIPIKILCACGQKYAFDVEPVGGRMGDAVQCPVCGADGAAAANELIAQHLAAQTAPPPALRIGGQKPPPAVPRPLPHNLAGTVLVGSSHAAKFRNKWLVPAICGVAVLILVLAGTLFFGARPSEKNESGGPLSLPGVRPPR